jgi:DNA invertase Pin-like site-specific DNA recombinase
MNHLQKRVGVYLRVSTDDQTVENQREALDEALAHRGWTVAEYYHDHGISGTKGRDKRPEFDRMLKDATKRKIDVVAAWSVDRLGRSLQDLVGMLGELNGAGCDLYLHQQSLDTTTPAGKAMFQMLGVFAEFEAAMIKARVKAGLARARKHGTRSGEPIGRPEIRGYRAVAIKNELRKGTGILKTAKLCGVGTSVVQRIKKEMTIC